MDESAKLWDKIEEAIEVAISMNRFEVYISEFEINDHHKKKLEVMGYGVYSDGRDGNHSYRISL